MQKHAVLLHSGSLASERPDEADTLIQTQQISVLLQQLGWETSALSYDLGETVVTSALQALEPDMVFNLVESALGSDEHSHRAPRLLDRLGLRYTGAGADCLRDTANKPRVKERLRDAGIPTPVWVSYSAEHTAPLPEGEYIVKSETEHGSLGLDESAIVPAAAVWFTITRFTNRHGGRWFAEQFIPGREFNVSLLADGHGGAEVLPLAEITFDGLPDGHPHIVDYAAKWDESSLSYRHTQRVFPLVDSALSQRLAQTARRCWVVCGLRGYARVDFRVAADGTPYVIDINPNPCLAADAGFLAAAGRAGLSPLHVIQRIIDNALLPPARHAPRALLG